MKQIDEKIKEDVDVSFIHKADITQKDEEVYMEKEFSNIKIEIKEDENNQEDPEDEE